MPLVSPKEMFAKAYAGGYAIGAFNVNNMEIIQGIMEAGKAENAPLILQVSAGARKYAGQNYIIKLMEAALQDCNLPVVLHLDHGPNFELCKDVIDGGFTSVMYDGSHLPYEENIEQTKRVVAYAHERGVWVEAELGRLAGVEEDVSSAEHIYTDPEQAADFVTRTGCDSLAIAIGTSHGAYKFKGEAKLDFDRLDKVSKLLPGVPIVLHGASSVPQEFVEMANAFGGQHPRRPRRARGPAAPRRRHGRVQDQHRHRHPPGDDGGHPQAPDRKPWRLRPQAVSHPGAHGGEGDGPAQDQKRPWLLRQGLRRKNTREGADAWRRELASTDLAASAAA